MTLSEPKLILSSLSTAFENSEEVHQRLLSEMFKLYQKLDDDASEEAIERDLDFLMREILLLLEKYTIKDWVAAVSTLSLMGMMFASMAEGMKEVSLNYIPFHSRGGN